MGENKRSMMGKELEECKRCQGLMIYDSGMRLAGKEPSCFGISGTGKVNSAIPPGKPIADDADFTCVYIGDTRYTKQLLATGRLPQNFSGIEFRNMRPLSTTGNNSNNIADNDEQRTSNTINAVPQHHHPRKMDARRQQQQGSAVPHGSQDRPPHNGAAIEPAMPTNPPPGRRVAEGPRRAPANNVHNREVAGADEPRPSPIRSWEDGTQHAKDLWIRVATSFPETFQRHAISHVNKGGEMAQKVVVVAGQIAGAAAAAVAAIPTAAVKSFENPAAGNKRGGHDSGKNDK